MLCIITLTPGQYMLAYCAVPLKTGEDAKPISKRCAQLCEQIDAPVINHPGHVLQTCRETVCGSLQDIDGVVMPRTFRCQPRSPQAVMKFASVEDTAFPNIVRVAGDAVEILG